MQDQFQYAAQKLVEPVGPDLWPLAMLYFDPQTRGLKCAVLSTGAELMIGHGRKIGVIMEARARELCKRTPTSAPTAKGVSESPAPSPQPPAAPAASPE